MWIARVENSSARRTSLGGGGMDGGVAPAVSSAAGVASRISVAQTPSEQSSCDGMGNRFALRERGTPSEYALSHSLALCGSNRRPHDTRVFWHASFMGGFYTIPQTSLMCDVLFLRLVT